MAAIVTRAGKGSPLTNAELDANFTNLNAELGGKGDVVGPAVSTHLGIPAFNGTSGKLLMGGGATLDATGQMALFGTSAALTISARSGSGSNWVLYNPSGTDFRLFAAPGGDRLSLNIDGLMGLQGPQAGVALAPRDGSGTTFTFLNPTGDTLVLNTGAADTHTFGPTGGFVLTGAGAGLGLSSRTGAGNTFSVFNPVGTALHIVAGGNTPMVLTDGGGLTLTGNAPGAVQTKVALVNLASTAGSGVTASFQPGGAPTRAAEIEAVNSGANQITLNFKVSNGDVPTTALTITPVGDATLVGELTFGVDADTVEPRGKYFAFRATSATPYTLVLGDKGRLIKMDVAAANSIIIPLNANAAFATKTRIDIVQWGAGQTSITVEAGVQLQSAGGKRKLAGQYSGASLVKMGADEWLLIGDLTA